MTPLQIEKTSSSERERMAILQSSIRQSSPHDILQAWQDGKISYREAMVLTASENLFELYQACRSSGVALRKEFTAREIDVVETVLADLNS